MVAVQHYNRIDTLELKYHMQKKLGQMKAEKYFCLLTRYLSSKISKCNFDRVCLNTIGRENICLHNNLLLSIIKNAQLSKTPPHGDKVGNGNQISCVRSLCKDIPQSPRRLRTPNVRRWKVRGLPSPLGPHGKNADASCEDSVLKTQDQSATELLSLGSRPPGSVEDGEEVEQLPGSPSIHSRSLVRAPLGIPINSEGKGRIHSQPYHSGTCYNRSELPDSSSLRKRLEQRVEMEGLRISTDSANLLNISLDVFLKRLIKPCLDLSNSRSQQVGRHNNMVAPLNGKCAVRSVQSPSLSTSVSMLDFQVVMDMNPQNLVLDWPTQLEKIHNYALRD